MSATLTRPRDIRPIPLEAWRRAVGSYQKAKTYENAVDVQRTTRNFRDHMKATLKEITDDET